MKSSSFPVWVSAHIHYDGRSRLQHSSQLLDQHRKACTGNGLETSQARSSEQYWLIRKSNSTKDSGNEYFCTNIKFICRCFFDCSVVNVGREWLWSRTKFLNIKCCFLFRPRPSQKPQQERQILYT